VASANDEGHRRYERDPRALRRGVPGAFADRQVGHELATSDSASLVVSPLVVAEADYMLFSRLGDAAARRFANDVASEAYELAEWNAADYAIAAGVMDRFSEPRDYIGVTDAANVVLADHYRTTDLLTLDQRHFRRLRPLLDFRMFVGPGAAVTAGSPGASRPACPSGAARPRAR